MAPHEGPFRQTYDRRWKLDNLQLLATLPGRNSHMLDASCHFYVPDRRCSVECSVCNFPRGLAGTRTALGSLLCRLPGTATAFALRVVLRVVAVV